MRLTGTEEAWTMGADHILERMPISETIAKLPNIPLKQADVVRALTALQILDEWHAPVVPDLSGEHLPMVVGHADAAAQLDLRGRFNSNAAEGSLIPRRGPGWRSSPTKDLRDEILRDYDDVFDENPIGDQLRCTVVLPFEIDASHPDDGRGPNRTIKVVYTPLSAAISARDRRGAHRILVSPVLEREKDLTIALSRDGKRYLVKPFPQHRRLSKILDQAYDNECSIILIPEMAVDKESLDWLQAQLAIRHSQHCSKFEELPNLTYVLVGVCETSNEICQNYVAVLSGDGELVFTQSKLSKWNLTVDEQRQYDLARPTGASPKHLMEAIEPSSAITIVDLPSLGRLAILICADMSISEPANWLYMNANLGWVYAPIMDKSNVPIRTRGNVSPWIVRRAHRAACATRGRILVTNSVALTHIVNRTNARRRTGYPQINVCHIGLFLDGTSESVKFESVTAPLTSHDIVEVRSWGDGWDSFLS